MAVDATDSDVVFEFVYFVSYIVFPCDPLIGKQNKKSALYVFHMNEMDECDFLFRFRVFHSVYHFETNKSKALIADCSMANKNNVMKIDVAPIDRK